MLSYAKIFYASGSFLFHHRNLASAGSTIIAPSMFTTNINVSKMPISIWNLSEENTHVLTPIASVIQSFIGSAME